MAGVVPTKRSTSGRKQWTLHDGPRSSLKRLRNQLANDGCAESQVVLAKQLLEEQCELDIEQRENDRLGVYWLIKSSEQGNAEATDLLKKCFSNGRGITEHNYMDVKSCINMTQDEKLARKAAREMFASLSNGEDYITSQQLQKRMLEIDKEQKSQQTPLGNIDYENEPSCNGELSKNFDEQSSESEEDVDWSQRSDENNEKLTEENIVTAAVNYAHGHLPLVNRTLCLTEPNLNALDHVPYVQRSILYPVLALKILYYKLIKWLGSKSFFNFVPSIHSDVQLVFIMLLYSFLSSSNYLYFIPMGIYYLTFFVMLTTTFQMLQMKRNFSDFRVWSTLFITYSGGSLNSQEAENQYIRNNLKPYGHFFITLLVNLLIYPIISNQWIPQSELTIIAFCLTFMTLHGFMSKENHRNVPDLLLLFSFAINVLAKYPYDTDPVVTQGWRFLDLKIPTFASYIIGNGIEFCLNFNFVFYMFIPFLFVRIASRENWRGTYKYLIPHCVTLSWLQIVIISSQGATMFGLLRGTLALVGVVMFLPLVGLTTVLLPAIAMTKWIATSISLYSLLVFLVFASIGFAISWLFAHTRFSHHVATLQVIFGLVTFYFLINSLTHSGSKTLRYLDQEERTLSWDQFQNFCHEPAWESSTIAVAQMRCSKLNNLKIEWEGYVNEVKIKSIKNTFKTALSFIPKSLSQHISCFFGEPIESDCNNFSDNNKDDCLLFYDVIKSTQKCSLDKFDTYSFEIAIRMHTSLWGKAIEIVLNANDHFKNFSLLLKPNDKIKFVGLLANSDNSNYDVLGGPNLQVALQEITCVTCHDTKLTEFKMKRQCVLDHEKILKDIYLGCKFVLNFLFYPIVVFK